MSENKVPVDGIVEFTRALVRTPSQAYEDDPKNIIGVIDAWAKERKLDFHKLEDDTGKAVGGYFHYSSGKPGPVICLDACVDTCQNGAPETWKNSPNSAKVEGDFLYGRGAADAKVAVSMFCHMFDMISRNGLNSGQVYVLLDADEHTGQFGGVKAFVKKVPRIDTVFIGYPGDKDIMIGSRGYLRATATVYGQAQHSGSRKPVVDNALVKMTQLIQMISSAELPTANDPDFPPGPKVTITAINGGQGFSQVPDKVDINVDMRLTPSFNETNAEKWLRDIIRDFDAENPGLAESKLVFNESWPAYVLPKTNTAAALLKENAERELGHTVALTVCGPSNIGNYLASKNIPAFCGFGVEYSNTHAPNESVRISSIEPAFKAYHQTIKALCP